MQCVWKEGGYEHNLLHNMWLLGAWTMFGSARKFDESGTGFCVPCVEMEGDRQLMSFVLKILS